MLGDCVHLREVLLEPAPVADRRGVDRGVDEVRRPAAQATPWVIASCILRLLLRTHLEANHGEVRWNP